MMGYQKGGDVKKKKKAKKKPMKMMADDGGSMTGKMDPKRKKVLDAIKANNSKPTPSMMPTAKNNTMPPKPQAPAGTSCHHKRLWVLVLLWALLRVVWVCPLRSHLCRA
jgi:hypothetical protein